MGNDTQPWSEAEATRQINKIARNDQLTLAYQLHCRERLAERGIIQSDVLYVLKRGFVQQKAAAAMMNGYFRYVIQTVTPNTPSREIGCCVISDLRRYTIKIVTVMFVDEKQTRAGSIIGEQE